MSLTYPLDILTGFPGWTTDFALSWRREFSREAGGRTRPKDIGPPLWGGAWQSRSLSPNELDHWSARLNALEDGLKTFRGYKLSRCYPIAYPRGSWPTGSAFEGEATIGAVGTSFNAIRLSGLPQGYQMSVGDMLVVETQDGRRDLHEAMEPAAAAIGGLTGLFEIRPSLWPGAEAGDTAHLVRPWVPMTIVSGSVSASADPSTGRGTITFQGLEARN